MPLNFTGRLPPPADPPPSTSRLPAAALAGFGVAAILAGLVLAVALRQHKAAAPAPPPPLVGKDASTVAAPRPAPPAPEPQWIEHKAVAVPPPEAAAPAQGPPAERPPAVDAQAAKARMLAALRQVPHGVITLSIEDDPDAQALADRLAGLFREAGWTVQESSAFGSGPPRRGLYAAFGISPADEAAREAFDAVGFQFAPPPEDAGITRTPEIFVGVPIRSSR